jgi:hypothetical protein
LYSLSGEHLTFVLCIRKFLMKSTIFSVLFLLLLSLSNIQAIDCNNNRTAPASAPYRWIPNQELKILFLKGDFTERERKGLKEAMDNWQQVLPQTGSGITLKDAGEHSSEEICDGCILVKRDPNMPKGYDGYIKLIKQKNGYYMVGIVTIKANIHKPNQLRDILHHELGHAFGLLDCPTCQSGTTVMNHFRRVSINGIPIFGGSSKLAKAPTPCDVQLVANGYKLNPTGSAPTNISSHGNIGNLTNQTVEIERPITEEDLDTTAPERGVGKEVIESAKEYQKPLSPQEKRLVDLLIAEEAENVAALNNYTFKREVTVKTIDKDGKVSGIYSRISNIVFDDAGNRVEKIIFFPPSTLKRLVMSKEDVDDFSGVQMLGIERNKINKYHIIPNGIEPINGINYRVFKVIPADLNQAKLKGERVFYGTVWADEKSSNIVKLKGKALPEGNQRFPTFETKRALIDGKYWFPVYTSADEILNFPNLKVHMRVTIRYSDYKRFRSELRIIDDDYAQK